MAGPVQPVILAGGGGTRLWPASRWDSPKQFLSLNSQFSMLQQTALRFMDGADHPQPWVICSAEHRTAVIEHLRQIDCSPSRVVLEPFGRSTAPAAAIAAILLAEKDPQALLLLAPADHVIQDAPAFHLAVQNGIGPAADGMLVTFGMKPERPETGFGYIEQGSALGEFAGCYAVNRFTEKPDMATARRLIEAGNHVWNSGIFLFRADSFLAELEAHEPTVLAACRRAIDTGDADAECLSLGGSAFEDCPAISIDHAVMERTKRAVVVPVQMDWSDVGSWASLWQIQDKDHKGNVISGPTVSIDSSNSYVRSDGPLVATIGLEGMVVVVTKDAVLVCPMERAQEVGLITDLINSEAAPASE